MSSLLRVSNLFLLFFSVLYGTFVYAAPTADHLFFRDTGNDFQKQNGLDAQKLNAQFASLSTSNPCQVGSMACVNGSFAQCTGGKWTLTPCASSLQCYALPLVKSPGTSLACDSQRDALARIAASGVSGGLTGSSTTTSNTPTNGTATDSDGDGNTDDCTDHNMTGSAMPMTTSKPSGTQQLYRRQTPTGSSARAAVQNGNPGQDFPVTPSPSPTLSPSANSTALSSSTETNTAQTQSPATSLPTATSTNQPSITTVTMIIVSTVTVAPSDCQTGVSSGLSSGSPTPLPTNSPSPTFTLSSGPSSGGILTTSSLVVIPSPSATGLSASSLSSTTLLSNSPTVNTNTNSVSAPATPNGANSTPTQRGIFFSTQNNIVALPTSA